MTKKSFILLTLSIFLLSSFLTSCSQFSFSTTKATYQKAEVLFEVTLPSKPAAGTKIQVEVLDDVTGLAFNPTRIDMIEKDDRSYYAKTAFTLNSIVKYRYIKTNEGSSVEFNSRGNPIRFRVLKVDEPVTVNDIVAAWQDEPFHGETGTIQGHFVDKATNTPLPDLLVTAEGVQAVTASDGSFLLTGITPGTHNLTAIALNGNYADFQQGALVAGNAVTPVFVGLDKRKTVEVTFDVTLPESFVPISDLKLASSMYSLGNLYADIYAGNTMISADLPVFQRGSNGNYLLTLTLPVGAYVNYKYTLGDGFWNGELTAEGSFRVRELIVPNKNTTIREQVAAFQPANSGPIQINVKVPADTPIEDTVSIQFNPYAWMSPLSMTKMDNQTWSYIVYNPQSYFGQTSFRFCRNTDCDLTGEVDPDMGTEPRVINPTTSAQTINTSVQQWAMLASAGEATTVTTEPQGMQSRTDFLSGFEIGSTASAILRSQEKPLLNSNAATGANWVILEPTWTISQSELPLIEPVLGKDLLWDDVLQYVQTGKQAGLAVALFPTLSYPGGLDDFWTTTQRGSAWWQNWFDQYHRFMIHFADAANVSGTSAIVVGDPSVTPSIQGGKLPDHSNSDAPSNADDQWRQLIRDIRSRYTGAIIGAVNLSNPDVTLPGWLDEVDAVYLLIRPEIPQESTASFNTIYESIDGFFDRVLSPIAQEVKKPVIIGLNVPSTADAYKGCLASGVNCFSDTSKIGDPANVSFDLQTKITNAVILSASSKSWVNGFFSRQYLQAGALQDTSDSVRGKPANDVLWYWYHFLGGKQQ